MNTETTKQTASASRNWVLYDGDCPWCAGLTRRLTGPLDRRGFAIAPLQTPWARERLGMAIGERPEEMVVLTERGAVLGGADAVVELAQHFWWARWLRLVARWPGGMGLLRTGYRCLAACRPCANGSCRRPRGLNWRDGALALSLPAVALAATWRAPGWALMWASAFALFAALKWYSWRAASPLARRAGWWRNAGFLLGWPGMDARAFLDSTRRVAPPVRAEWIAAIAKTLLGGVIVWVVTRQVAQLSPPAAGWMGMIGIVLCLHFGLFHLLSLAWRRTGVNAAPIMNAPLRATSLAAFWGRRWNLGFSVPARRFLLKPLAARYGNAIAMLAVFLASGLLHELVISLPARADFGLPTAYFALQGVAMLVERSAVGRWLGLTMGWRGRTFAMLCVVGPVFWLFHPPFVHRVILPFLHTIGAL